MKKGIIKIIVVIVLLFVSQFSFAQQNSFTVSGKIKGLDSKYMHIVFKDETGTRRDSIAVINESFSYTTSIKEMTMISISPGVEAVMKRTGRGYFPAKSSLLQFVATPGADKIFWKDY